MIVTCRPSKLSDFVPRCKITGATKVSSPISASNPGPYLIEFSFRRVNIVFLCRRTLKV
jgi:hypothetical protein